MSGDTRIVLDLETQKSFQEVAGRQPSLLKVSLVGIYEYATGQYRAFLEHELGALEQLLRASDQVIGFNIKRFDFEVLAPYFTAPVADIAVFDIMDEVTRLLGHRVSLDSLAEATLGQHKGGSGLDALRFFKEGRWEELTAYCLKDVQLTKDLYEYGMAHGELKCTPKYSTGLITIPVNWNISRKRVIVAIEEAFKRRLRVELEYVVPREGGVHERIKRAVDIYAYDGATFEGYCHLRQELRHFRIERVLDARPTFLTYQVPADYRPSYSGAPASASE